jgi:pantetheine-phosphate adenylyltransferase
MVLIYPGSFDPVTNGHLDIIERACAICDKLVVAVGNNERKNYSFTINERINLLRLTLGDRDDVYVTDFSGLLADFARKMGAKAVIKGLRAVSDFEYEFQMALLNKSLEPNLETLFMMTSVNYSYLSSSAVKEIARNGGSIDGLVPDRIKDLITAKLAHEKSI